MLLLRGEDQSKYFSSYVGIVSEYEGRPAVLPQAQQADVRIQRWAARC